MWKCSNISAAVMLISIAAGFAIEAVPAHGLTAVRLRLDQPGKGGEIEAAWDEEIRARVKAVDEGRVAGIPYDQIKKEVTGRFIPR